MNQKITLTAGCLSAALLCTPASANDFQGRWYFGLGGGVSRLEPDTDTSQYDIDETEDTSARVVIGRDLTNRLSVELYFADLGEMTLKPKATAVNPVADPYVGYQVGGLHLLAYFFNSDGAEGRHYRDSFSMFAKIGAGTMDNEANVEYERLEDLHLSLGFGMEGLIAGGVSWRFEVDGYDVDAAQASLSLVKRFGAVTSVYGSKVAA
ncbi:MAG: outer membrane beta-barrel protein, partial [Granulosicoccaceae bacterium]